MYILTAIASCTEIVLLQQEIYSQQGHACGLCGADKDLTTSGEIQKLVTSCTFAQLWDLRASRLQTNLRASGNKSAGGAVPKAKVGPGKDKSLRHTSENGSLRLFCVTWLSQDTLICGGSGCGGGATVCSAMLSVPVQQRSEHPNTRAIGLKPKLRTITLHSTTIASHFHTFQHNVSYVHTTLFHVPM